MRHLTFPIGPTPSWARPTAQGQKHIHYQLHNKDLARNLCDWAIQNQIEVFEHGDFRGMRHD